MRSAAGFFGDEPIVVVSGDSLNELDVGELVAAHRESGVVATIVVQPIADVSPFGAVLVAEDGRITGFQEKPHPAEALSDLASCGIYCLSREVFEYFPAADPVDWARDVFPVLLENDVPLHAFRTDAYWNDIGSPAKLREANWRALEATGGTAWVGRGCEIEAGVELIDRVVIGRARTSARVPRCATRCCSRARACPRARRWPRPSAASRPRRRPPGARAGSRWWRSSTWAAANGSTCWPTAAW